MAANGTARHVHVVYAAPLKCQVDILEARGTELFQRSATGGLLTYYGVVSEATPTTIDTGSAPWPDGPTSCLV